MQAAAATTIRSTGMKRRLLPSLRSTIIAIGTSGVEAHRPPPTAIGAAATTSPPSFSSSTRRPGDGDPTKVFGDYAFWEGHYASQRASQATHDEPFEWFLPYEGGLREHLLTFLESIPPCSRLLHVGCGTSEVGPKLAQEPDLSLHVTDTDNSPSAVSIMKQRYTSLDNYTCREMDVLNLDFPDGSFDAIVDKGTLDALLCRSVEDAHDMVAEMHRVLTKGGIYVQVAKEDPEARLELLRGRGGFRREEKEKQQQGHLRHHQWRRSFFKELGELGESAEASYFMYVLIK